MAISHSLPLRGGWQRLFHKIVNDETERFQTKQNNYNASSIVAFASSSRLPKDVSIGIANFFPVSIRNKTIQAIDNIISFHKYMEILRNGSRGEGLILPLSLTPPHRIKAWLRKYQQPRLLMSQPEFHDEIRKKAIIILFHKLNLQGNVEKKLTTFAIYLLAKF